MDKNQNLRKLIFKLLKEECNQQDTYDVSSSGDKESNKETDSNEGDPIEGKLNQIIDKLDTLALLMGAPISMGTDVPVLNQEGKK